MVQENNHDIDPLERARQASLQEGLQKLSQAQRTRVILINQLVEVSRNAQGQQGITPLMWQAAFGGEFSLSGLNAILRFTENVNQTDASGRTALMYAAIGENQRGSVRCCEALIRAGADINARCQSGLSALDLACVSGNIGVIDVLIRQGVNVNQSYGVGATEITPLRLAIRNGQTDVVKFLLERGAIVQEKDIQLLMMMPDQNKAREIVEQLKPYTSQEMMDEAVLKIGSSDFSRYGLSLGQTNLAFQEVNSMRLNRRKTHDSERDLKTEDASDLISRLGYTPNELRYLLPTPQGITNVAAGSVEDTINETGFSLNLVSYNYVPKEVLSAIRLAQYDVIKGYENEESLIQAMEENSALKDAVSLQNSMLNSMQPQQTGVASVYKTIKVIKDVVVIAGGVAAAGGVAWVYNNPKDAKKYFDIAMEAIGQNSKTIDRGIQNAAHLSYATSTLFREQSPEQLEERFGELLSKWKAVATNTDPQNFAELQEFLNKDFTRTGNFGCNNPNFAKNLQICYDFARRNDLKLSDLYAVDVNKSTEYKVNITEATIRNCEWNVFKKELRMAGIENDPNDPNDDWDRCMREESTHIEERVNEIAEALENVRRKFSICHGIELAIDNAYRSKRQSARSSFDERLSRMRDFRNKYADYPKFQNVDWNEFDRVVQTADKIFNVEQGGEITEDKKIQLEVYSRYVNVVSKVEEVLTPPGADLELASRIMDTLKRPQERLRLKGQLISSDITTGKIIEYTDAEGNKEGPFFPVVIEKKIATGSVIERSVYLLPYNVTGTETAKVGETTVLSDPCVQKFDVPAACLTYSINGSIESLVEVTEYNQDQGKVVAHSYEVINGAKVQDSDQQQEVSKKDVMVFQRDENSSEGTRTLALSSEGDKTNVGQTLSGVAEPVAHEGVIVTERGGTQNG
ncbi:MAG: ankyrin repeat domain-containing protein [Alphaproteobacteria bacterium]|nr:ankyrin repeat domain-containing protein [Alphaproteobacteria bacterium]